MSRKSDFNNRNKYRSKAYPMIDDRTGFRISSKDAVEDWGGIITHRKNEQGMPQSLVKPIFPKNELKQPGPIRPEKRFHYASPSVYYFEGDVSYNDVSYKTSAGMNAADLNPDIIELQLQFPEYWDTVDAVWDATLMKWVNRTYNENIQFSQSTFEATFGDDFGPRFVQVQPE